LGDTLCGLEVDETGSESCQNMSLGISVVTLASNSRGLKSLFCGFESDHVWFGAVL